VGNRFSADGGASIAKILSRRLDIVSIALDGNAIDDDGAASIAIVMRTHPALQKVSLKTNRIGDRGLAAIAEGVRVSRSLKQLYLWGNRFEAGAAEAFYKVQKKLDALEAVDFGLYVVDDKPMIMQKGE
jgi:hypothetical protein